MISLRGYVLDVVATEATCLTPDKTLPPRVDRRGMRDKLGVLPYLLNNALRALSPQSIDLS